MDETILLVDGDAGFRQRLQCVLEAGGYDVITAADATVAQGLLDTTEVAVVIMGLALSDEATQVLVSGLGSDPNSQECILLAEKSALAALINLYETGNVYNHCWKPLEEIGDLARTIGRALERRALKRQNAYLLTQLRDARDELRSQSEFLVQVEKLASLGSLCASVVADIQQPLFSLADSAGKAGLDVEERVARRLLHRVEALSGFATGRSAVHRRVSLHALIEEGMDLLLPALTEGGIRVAVSAESPDLEVQGDPNRLLQLLVYLALNSLKAMPEGGSLTIRAERTSTDSGSARLVVEDTGSGIAPDVLPYVFEPFYTTRPLGEGTGLGLSIVRDIVKEHEGEIDVQSTLGLGTTVCVTLPLAVGVGASV